MVCVTHLVEHVDRQAHHGEVVNNENDFKVNRLPALHQTSSSPDHTKVNQEDEGHGDGGVDQQPWVSPLIWTIIELHIRVFRTDSNVSWHSWSQMHALISPEDQGRSELQ